jgi:hypothetical protein
MKNVPGCGQGCPRHSQSGIIADVVIKLYHKEVGSDVLMAFLRY